MSTIPVFIPYINRLDLLRRAVSLVPRRLTTEPIVIDNSGDPKFVAPCTTVHPPVPLTFTQSQNLMLKIAKERRVPFYMWMHCDAEPAPDAVERLYERAMHECSVGTKWGVIFTFYDILCAYNTAAFDAIGGYDTAFFDYCSDIDAYRRLDLAGYSRLESGIEVKHEGSASLNSDPAISRLIGLQVPYRGHYYRAKWGGDGGHETFLTPFNQ
jgi:hypothetical protein